LNKKQHDPEKVDRRIAIILSFFSFLLKVLPFKREINFLESGFNLNLMKSNLPKQKTPIQMPESDDWDFVKEMGIIPEDISLTQNIGCVGESRKNKPSKRSDKNDQS
jgi:hypothetical protein